jgi:hypothetical protein
MVTKKIEVGFNILSGPVFTLDDTAKGVLDNTDFVLAGSQLVDVTAKTRSYSINRGRSRELDRYQTGTASVVFDNRNRDFDPTYTLSPYYGNIIPRRDVRITVNDIVQYTGVIDDWNLTYNVSGDSVTSGAATDGFAVLAKQTLTGGTATAQATGARIASILDRAEVNWPLTDRDIDAGDTDLGADVIADNENVLQYLQLIETSEQGDLFIAKDGKLTFKARYDIPSTNDALLLSDDGSGIPYQNIDVVYGSELLYNEIIVSSSITSTTATASDTTSQQTYGIANYTLENLPIASDTELVDLAVYLASRYANPEYRFESIDVLLDDLTEAEQNQVLGLEMGDIVRIRFSPNNVPPAVEKYAQVINIQQSGTIDRTNVRLGFRTLDVGFFILNDAVFGMLDEGNILAY